MRTKLSLLFALLAWLLATGSHWDLVQTFAWGRMVAVYSRTMPLAEAIRLTFTPENMCGVCEAVAEAQQTDSHSPTPPAREPKIQLACTSTSLVLVVPPAREPWRRSLNWTSLARPQRPPVPPPRLA